jgi:Ca-activated chloride channel family protein
MAKKLGVKVYTVGVGSDRPAAPHSALSYLQMMNQAPALDEPLLRKLASETGGRYFRATDAETLEGIFQIIDRLEASELEGRTFTRYRELAAPLLALALALLLLDLLLGLTLLEVLP